MRRGVSKALTLVYWIALPCAALVSLLLGLSLIGQTGHAAGPQLRGWAMFATSLATTSAIIWRLWLHDRARSRAGDASETTPEG